jgi:hypothetical protein
MTQVEPPRVRGGVRYEASSGGVAGATLSSAAEVDGPGSNAQIYAVTR